MKKQLHTLATLVLLASTAFPALASESVDVSIVGTIVPAACTPTISGSGVVDYGDISSASLSADSYTLLDVKSLEFSINCDAPTRVGFFGINGRPGTLAGIVGESASGYTDLYIDGYFGDYGDQHHRSAGLGMDGGAKVGGYTIRLKPGTSIANGDAAKLIGKTEYEPLWTATEDVTHGALFSPMPWINSWSTGNGTSPLAVKNVSAQLEVQAFINKTSELDLSKPIALDGLTTFELVYL
jgi:hypothetical protein